MDHKYYLAVKQNQGIDQGLTISCGLSAVTCSLKLGLKLMHDCKAKSWKTFMNKVVQV